MTERTALAERRRHRAATLAIARRRGDRILDAALVGILRVDVDGRITFANPSAARMMGDSVEELRGQPVQTYMLLTSPDSAEQLCWRGDGTSFPIEYESAPLGDAALSEGTVVTFRDVTQRRVVDRLKDELIAVVSHELRTPLTSIRSSLGLLAGGVLGAMPEQGRRMLEIAVTNTDRLIRLVNDVLDLEAANAGKIRMQPVACDAGELMNTAADGVRAMAKQAGVLLKVLPHTARLRGDPDRLLQVLTNLLSNAIKFSPPTGGTVWIEAEHSANEVVFRVRDEGSGIPADKLESIFDRFGQVNESDWREKGGTGLGLAISRSIVNQHNGHIWVESTLGVGTTLCVALPSGQPDTSPPSEAG